jgi:hypothetical protein
VERGAESCWEKKCGKTNATFKRGAIALGSYRTPFPQSRTKRILLVSDDDGATWGQVPFETNQTTTFFNTLAVVGGRVVITGGNGAVYTSDFTVPLKVSAPEQLLWEANSGNVLVSRPDAEGAVNASYRTVGLSARAGTDFAPATGTLEWAADDLSEKSITITALDNATRDPDRIFTLELSYETADGLVGAIETPVAIQDDDSGGGIGLVFDGATKALTTEAGTATNVRVALEARPGAVVTITLTGLDTTEGALSRETLTFTPENWNVFQDITITGVGDTYYDGDTTYDLIFSTTSEDTAYADLPPVCIAVTNTSDERYVPGGEFFDRLGPAYIAWTVREGIPVDESGPFADPNGDGVANVAAYAFGLPPVGASEGTGITINADRTLTFSVPTTVENLTFAIQTGADLEILNWEAGPAPTPGAPSGGSTPYTAKITADAPANFARVLVGIAE